MCWLRPRSCSTVLPCGQEPALALHRFVTTIDQAASLADTTVKSKIKRCQATATIFPSVTSALRSRTFPVPCTISLLRLHRRVACQNDCRTSQLSSRPCLTWLRSFNGVNLALGRSFALYVRSAEPRAGPDSDQCANTDCDRPWLCQRSRRHPRNHVELMLLQTIRLLVISAQAKATSLLFDILVKQRLIAC